MARGPVFVCGCPRSGTSALGWAVAASPYYWTSVETHFFFSLLGQGGRNRIFDAFQESNVPGSWTDKHEITYRTFLSYVGSGLNAMMRSRADQVHWVDNSPENLLVADDLLMMIPESTVVHVIRDPREVCASMLLSGFDRETWSSDLDSAISTWTHYLETGKALMANWPGRVLEIMHSKMRQDPDHVAAAISKFLEIPDAGPIARFLQSERINSSYDASSQLATPGGKSLSATTKQHKKFLKDNEDYILSRTQPFAAEFGFGV